VEVDLLETPALKLMSCSWWKRIRRHESFGHKFPSNNSCFFTNRYSSDIWKSCNL